MGKERRREQMNEGKRKQEVEGEKGDYRIHSNKCLGHLDKSFWVGTYLFQFCWKDQPKNGSFGPFVILRFITSKFDWWVLIVYGRILE